MICFVVHYSKIYIILAKVKKGYVFITYPLSDYSTVTDFARFRGLSISQPLSEAT